MRYRGILRIKLDPAGEIVPVKHSDLRERLRALFLFDPDLDRVVREEFSVAELVEKLEAVFRALEITDLTRIVQAGSEHYFDPENRPDDLFAGLAAFRAERGSLADYDGTLQIVMTKVHADLESVIRITVRKKHAVAEFPLTVEIDALSALGIEADDADGRFRHFFLQWEQNLGRVLSLGEVKQEIGAATIARIDPAPEPAPAVLDRPAPRADARLYPLYGVTLGKTTVDELAKLGQHAKDKDDEGKLYRYYVVGDMNFWYDNGRASSIYITHTDGMPEPWRELGFDWDLSYDEWYAVLESLGCFLSVTTPPQKVRHYSGEYDSFEAGLNGLLKSEEGTLSIELNFNYSSGTRADDRDTLYGISMRLR